MKYKITIHAGSLVELGERVRALAGQMPCGEPSEPGRADTQGPLSLGQDRSALEVQRPIDTVVRWLRESGYKPQADVICACLETSRGEASRGLALELAGRGPDGKLVRFSMPVTRIASDLAARGLVPAGMPAPLEYHLDGGRAVWRVPEAWRIQGEAVAA